MIAGRDPLAAIHARNLDRLECNRHAADCTLRREGQERREGPSRSGI
jgi:hypothetical protein